MKLAVATLALALVQGGIAQEDATSSSQTDVGTCLTTASANASSNQDGDNEEIEWNDKASYYADANNVEYNVAYNLAGLAEMLGLEFDYDANDDANDEAAEEDQDDKENMYKSLASLGHVSYYDEELAKKLGLDSEDDFDKLDSILFALALSGGLKSMDSDSVATFFAAYTGYDPDAEVDADADADADADDDAQNNYENLNKLSEALYEWTLNTRIEAAIAQANIITIADCANAVDETDADDANADDADDANAAYDNNDCANAADTNYQNVLEILGDDDLDDEIIRTIQFKLAVKSGALEKYLETYASYGIVVDDWEGIFEGFAESISLEGDFKMDDIDTYLATDIYNTAYDVEELGCQAAMIDQFGEETAIDLGYVTDKAKSTIKTFLDSCASLSTGAIVGIAIAVLAVALLVAFLTYKCGRSKAAADKKAPLIDVNDKESVHSETSAEPEV